MKQKTSGKKSAPTKIRVSHTRKPVGMNEVEQQIGLRRQIAEDENFGLSKISDGPVFGECNVYNEKTVNTYKVVLRSADNSLNFVAALILRLTNWAPVNTQKPFC